MKRVSVPTMTPKYSAVQNSGWACRFALPLLALALLSPGDLRAAEAGSASGDPIVYEIVVTGGELLAGVYADSHTQFLTQTLHPLGLRCVGSISVDDKRADIAEALGFAVSRAKLVIVTGGLGPTENDITREALSEFTGIALQERPEVLRGWAERLRHELGVPVRVADEPQHAVVRGAGACVDDLRVLRRTVLGSSTR